MESYGNINMSSDGKGVFSVLLMSLYTSSKDEEAALSSLGELARLVETAFGDKECCKISTMTQLGPTPVPACYFGTGKAAEDAEFCRNNGVSLVVADCELSPSQIKNLEDAINFGDSEIRVIDLSLIHI